MICLPFSLALLLGSCTTQSEKPGDKLPLCVPGHKSLINAAELGKAPCRREAQGVFIYSLNGGEYRLNLNGKDASITWGGEGHYFREWAHYRPEGLPDAGIFALVRQGMDGYEIQALLGPPIEKDNVWRLADGSRLKLDWPGLREFTLISADGLSLRMKQLPILTE
jgi:hypothetical protein